MANSEPTINTSGGATVGNSVQTGRDFVGRDQTITTTNVIFWITVGSNFVEYLEDNRQNERKKLKELEEKKRTSSSSNKTTDSGIDSSSQRIAELEQTIAELEHFDWPKAEQSYLDKVIKLYDRVRILGNSIDTPLGDVFTQVYILDKPTAHQRHDIENLRKQGLDRLDFQRQPGIRTRGIELVRSRQNLFILGKPGAGKTTFLKYITLQAARKQLQSIPIFISLNQWADSKWGQGDKAALLPFIIEQFEICDFPDAAPFINYLLQEGRAIVLFDGLDEVKQEQLQRHRLTRLLQEFARKYDKSQHLITCRIAASDYAFAGFADVEVADFTPEQVDEYARHWFGKNTKKAEAFAHEITRPENRGLAELANTPLLLSMLCLTFDNAMRFPPNRAELYEDALEALLRKWDSSRQIQRDEIYRQLSHKRKLHLLTTIAVPTFEEGELFFRQRDLEKRIVDYLARLPDAPPADTIDGTVILKAMEAQHSILVERAQGIYSFSHLTFQEYLTARYLVENQGRGVIDRLIAKHLPDPRWREVLLLTASLLENADDFVAALRTTTQRLLTSAPRVVQLLRWADERTTAGNTPTERRIAVRIAYIFLDPDIARSSARSLTRVPALDPARAPVLAFAQALTQAPARALDRVRELARTLAFAIAPAVGVDYVLYYAWCNATLFTDDFLDRRGKDWQAAMQGFSDLLTGVIDLADEAGSANEAGLVEVARRLHSLLLPSITASGQEWQKYADALFAILRDERDLAHDWGFTKKDIDTLNDYFYASELLVQCLQVAVISDRQAILAGLLSPPTG